MEHLIITIQIGLALIFLYFGLLKLFLPIERIEKKVSWAHDYSHQRLKLFGLLEILGALGLVIPYYSGVLPILTPIAATALAMVMAGATMVHLRRDEFGMIALNILIIFLRAGVGFNTLLSLYHVQPVLIP